MDKYEYKVRADEIKSLIAAGEYAEAVKIADTIDWRRVKSVMMLCTISDLYKINRRYEDSRDILLLAYERHSGGRLIVYSLCELSIKLEEYVQAIEYYKEFVQLAPKDSGCFVLQYKLYEAQEVSLEERIAVLEALKKRDYREKWAYELAYLYHRVGLASKCIEECDEMFLWFGEGRYVLKALELKQLHTTLSPEQQEKYEMMKQTGGNIQSELAAEQNAIKEEAERETEEEEDNEFSLQENLLTDPTQELPGKELDDIQVKTVDVSQYNTINLQKELAESMKEFLENHPTEEMPVEQVEEEISQTKVFEPIEGYDSVSSKETAEKETAEAEETPIPSVRQDTDEMQLISDVDLNESKEGKPVSEEVFFGNTAEVNIEDVVSELVEKNAEQGRITAPVSALPTASPNPAVSNTGVIKTFHKPSGYDDILSQEYDGQLSLVVPEEEKVEKQITGQLSIEDIMAEWERIKKENELKRMEEIKKRVHQQTDTLFADFDESTKSGLLEELEKAMVTAAIQEEKKKADLERPKVVKVADMEQLKGQKAEKAVLESPETESAEISEDTEVQEAADAEESVAVQESAAKERLEVQDVSLTQTASASDEKVKEAEGTETEEISEEEESAEAEEISKEAEDTEAEDDSPQEENKAEELAKKETSVVTDIEKSGEEAEDKSRTREMSAGEREQFAPFIHHKKTRRQIVDVLDNISMASYTGNVVITGEEGTGTTALAKLLVKEVQLSDSNFSGKVAKISGATMNKKDVAATLAKLSGGALIVEDAAGMKKAAVEALIKVLNQEGSGLIVLLEDSRPKMEDFLAKYEELGSIFNLRVDVEALDDQTLVKYAKKYALDQEYSIDELGVLALHTRIADMQTSDHEVTLAEIEELVDEAIYYADKKTPAHFFDVLFGKRYDEEDMIILREKDFMHY